MAYDESSFRRYPAADPTDPDSAGYRTTGMTADYRGRRRGGGTDPEDGGARHADLIGASGHRVTGGYAEPAGYVDDPGRDRLGVHIGWEIVLLLALAAVGYLLYHLDPAALRRPALDSLLISATVVGLLTIGAGITLRAGVPNVAVGPIAVAAALHYAENGDRGLVPSSWPALAIAAGGGLLVALVVLVLHVPGWAATLAGALGVIVFNQLRVAPMIVQGEYDPSNQAFFLFGGFALLAVIGGALGTAAPVRRMLGRLRPVGDPARRGRPSPAVPVIGALVASSVLAAVAGILFAAQSTKPIVPGTGLDWTGLAVGLAMVAGTSAYGRRGGIFGTLLAVAGMALFLDYAQRRNFEISMFAIAGGTLAAGLVVTRLVETYGRSPVAVEPVDQDWQANPQDSAAWSAERPETWSSTVPAPGRADRWGDEGWGTAPR